MRSLRMQIYANGVTVPQDWLTMMFRYYKRYGITLNYDITPVSIAGYSSSEGFNSNRQKVYVLRGHEKSLPKTDHDITVFAFSLDEWKAPWYWPFPYWNFGPKGSVPTDDCQMYGNKPLISMSVTPQSLMNLLHEPIHAFAKIANRDGFPTSDILDSYFKNDIDHYLDKDSNFSMQMDLLKPWIDAGTPPQGAVVPVADTSLDKWQLVPPLKEKALKFLSLAKSKGYSLKITQGFRDPAYQDKLYAQGRTLPGKIVTNATGKTSKHCLGKAFDIAFTGKDPYPAKADWKAIGEIGKTCGLSWGGDWTSFKDLLHYEI